MLYRVEGGAMRVYGEAKIVGGRVDYLLELSVGVEVKSLEEVTSSPDRVIEQINRYAEELDVVILLIDINEPSDIALQYIKEIADKMPANVTIAYGNPLNTLTWRPIRDKGILDIIKSNKGD
jgi:hypothetical protein